MGLKVNSHLGVRRIGDTLTFYAETTDSTGLAVDADAVPGYRIYEEETGTAIVTGGTMALLDSANTAGLYSEQITLASATGYEFNKDYVIYVTATVAGIASADIYTFKIGPETALFSGLASAGAAGSITLVGTPATDDLLNGLLVAILSGAGAGQARIISDYVGATLVASVTPNWITNPGATSVFAIYPQGAADVRMWLGVVPNALISGRVDSNTQAMANDVVTAAAIANGAIDAATFAAGAIDAAAIGTGAIDADAIAADAIGSSELAASAVTEIQSGLATSAALALVQADTDDIQTRLPAALVGGRMDSSVGAMAAAVVTAAAIATDAIDADALATDAVTEIENGIWNALMTGHVVLGSFGQRLQAARASTATGGGASSITLDAGASGTTSFYNGMLCLITAGTGAIQARIITAYNGVSKVATVSPAWTTAPAAGSEFVLIPAMGTGAVSAGVWDELRALHAVAGSFGEGVASVQGNVTGSVGSVAAGGITAASIATNAVDADALAADAVAEIQAGLATAAALALVQADTDDIQTRLPASLSGGRMRSQVEGMDAGTVTAAAVATDAIDADAIAASAVTEIQAGLATAAALATVQADTDDIQTRLPAALVGGRMDSSVGAMAAGVVTAAAIATGAIDADALAADAVDEIVDQNWNELIAGHLGAGSTGEALNNAAAGGAADWTAAERSQIRQALGVTGAVAATDATGDVKTLTAAIQADTNDLQTRVPLTLNAGRMRSHVEACDPPCAPAGGGGLTAAQVEAAVWDASKAAHQGDTIMGNIAQDTDNQEFEIQPG